MQSDQLLLDLKALHPGRGVRRPRIRTWLGPELTRVLHPTDTTTDAELASVLITLLLHQTETLPRDMAWLFRLASGITSDLPHLESRLAVAEKRLERSTRVLRRQLRHAERLLADAIHASHAERSDFFAATGWKFVAHGLDLVLREDAVLTIDRTVIALRGSQHHLVDAFHLPGIRPDEEVEFEGVHGLKVTRVERRSATMWRLSVTLDHKLGTGDSLPTMLRVRVPRARAMAPFFVLAPVREIGEARVTIDFGDPPVAASVWPIDGVMATEVVTGSPLDGVTPEPLASPVVAARYTAPKIGFAYGFGWEWTG